jgi:hypothetical protein
MEPDVTGVLVGQACADVPPQTATLLWEYAAESTADLMVDGFSRVRKCTEMGRGCMSLDLQVS